MTAKQWGHEKHKETAEKMRLSIINKDFSSLSYILAEEWENRKNLAEGVTTEKIEFLMERAGKAGAMASKICGAGGGGCMISLVEPEKKEHVVSAWKRRSKSNGIFNRYRRDKGFRESDA